MMTRSEYDKLKASIEEEHQRNLDALDRIFKIAQDQDSSSSVPAKLRRKAGSGPVVGNGKLFRAVLGAKGHVNADFTRQDIIDYLKRDAKIRFSEKSMKTVLWKMKEEGHIEVARQGAGRRPSVYRWK
jgi:hypothetical protein